MRSKTPAFLAILFAAALAGCGDGVVHIDDGDGGGGEVPPPLGAGVTVGSLSTENAAYALAVTELYVVPSCSPDWGYDLLAGDVILPGEALELALLDEGYYDALAVFEGGHTVVEYDIEVTGGEVSAWQAVLGTVVVRNLTSSSYVDELYLVQSWEPDWGWDFLDGDWIAPGEDYYIFDVPEEWYDGLAVFDDHGPLAEYDMPVQNGQETVWELSDW